MRKVLRICTTSFLVLFCFVTVFYTACKKEDTLAPVKNACTGVVCQNNGSCVNGVCNCAAGYEGVYCQIASNNRYLGKWSMNETITNSTKSANINKTKSYVMTIKKGELSLDLLFDNLSGTYNNIKGILSRKYTNGIPSYASVTNFVISSNQKDAATNVMVLSGEGNVNDLGSDIAFSYAVEYFDNGVLVRDNISVTGSVQQ